jgi:SMI1-KNR4 cell-wall
MIQVAIAPGSINDELSEQIASSSVPATEEQVIAAERELGVVFPPGYRTFLFRFGTARLKWLDIFGIPHNCLWGDIVMMNQLAPVKIPAGCILFARDARGAFYYLKCTSVWTMEESPVIRVNLVGASTQVAGSFAEFLVAVARS